MAIVVFMFLITVILIVFFLITNSFEKEKKVKDRLDSYVQLRDPKELKASAVKEKLKFKHAFAGSTVLAKNKLRKLYNNTLPSQKEDELQKKLLRAGNPFNMTVADYYIINNIIRVIVPLIFITYAIVMKFSIQKSAAALILGFLLSFKALDYYIHLKTKERYKRALRELPDFLDILTISVEAGLGFDMALNKTIEKRRGIICFEFHTCLEEMRLGKIRKEALAGVKERLAFDEMISFINSVLQSERLGTGIVQTLRAKSEDERDKRKQRAEEQAMKTTIKILLPLVFFIFPTIFIVVFGPAVIQLTKNLGGFIK